MKVYIDGIEVLNPQETTINPTITIRRRNEAGEQSVSFTGELSFVGQDYQYIYNKLVDAPNAINNEIVLLLVDECCGDKEYRFLIKPESLKWCEGSCEITANAVEYTENSEQYACLENTMIWDNTFGFQSFSHPKVTYCKEYRPSILQDAVLIIGTFTILGATTLVALIATVIVPLLGTVNLIISAVNLIIGIVGGTPLNLVAIAGITDPIQLLQFIINTFTQTNGQLVAGCGYEHPSPLVRDYITNFCAKCNIGFSSSILDEPNNLKPNFEYFNLLYFSAPIKSGRIQNTYFVKPLVPYIDENKPLHTGKTFLEELVQPFNANWDIVNNVLRFERKDFFENQTPWFDVTAYDSEKVILQCFEWASAPRPAFAQIGYERDALDWVGSEATEIFSDIIEWNLPYNPKQKGALVKTFPYSTARFRDDGLERDVLGAYDWLPFGVGANIKQYAGSMIMNNGTSWLPKLLIWDINQSLIQNAKVISYNNGGRTKFFNYPMAVDANYTGNLYDRFWQIEDPRNASFSGFEFEIQIVYNCEIKNLVNINGNIMTSRGLSKTISLVELNFETNKMTIKGTI